MNLRRLDSPIRINREAEFSPESFDEERGEVEIVWTTGAEVTRRGWDGPYREQLDLDGARLGFLNSGRAPFLDSHNARSVSAVIDRIVENSAKVSEGLGIARVRLSQAPEHAGIVENIRAGIVRNVSVGYDVHAVEEIAATDDSIKIIRATDWEPLEVSAVPIGADPDAQTRSLADAYRAPGPSTTESKMSEETKPTVETPAAPDLNVIRAEAVKADRERTAVIMTTARKLVIDDKTRDEILASDKDVDAARAALIDAAADADDKTAISSHVTGGGLDANVTRGEEMIKALLWRSDPDRSERPDSEIGKRYANMSLTELARDSLGWHGVNDSSLSRSAMVNEALKVRVGGMHSTSDFPLILAAVANKRLRGAYEESPPSFAPFCRRVTATDFKLQYPTQLGEFPTLEKVNEHGEFRRKTVTEGRESYQLATYGNILGITRQAIVNDDLGAFSRLPQLMGAAARRLESNIVWALIVDNDNMADGSAQWRRAERRPDLRDARGHPGPDWPRRHYGHEPHGPLHPLPGRTPDRARAAPRSLAGPGDRRRCHARVDAGTDRHLRAPAGLELGADLLHGRGPEPGRHDRVCLSRRRGRPDD
jgi:hypothetical protein